MQHEQNAMQNAMHNALSILVNLKDILEGTFHCWGGITELSLQLQNNRFGVAKWIPLRSSRQPTFPSVKTSTGGVPGSGTGQRWTPVLSCPQRSSHSSLLHQLTHWQRRFRRYYKSNRWSSLQTLTSLLVKYRSAKTIFTSLQRKDAFFLKKCHWQTLHLVGFQINVGHKTELARSPRASHRAFFPGK